MSFRRLLRFSSVSLFLRESVSFPRAETTLESPSPSSSPFPGFGLARRPLAADVVPLKLLLKFTNLVVQARHAAGPQWVGKLLGRTGRSGRVSVASRVFASRAAVFNTRSRSFPANRLVAHGSLISQGGATDHIRSTIRPLARPARRDVEPAGFQDQIRLRAPESRRFAVCRARCWPAHRPIASHSAFGVQGTVGGAQFALSRWLCR